MIYATYIIARGAHSSGWHWPDPFLRRTGVEFRFRLHADCAYAMEGEDRYDWNKLYGFSQLVHQRNSLRVGWRARPDGQYETALYCHRAGVISAHLIPEKLSYDTWRRAALTIEAGEYVYYDDLGNRVAIGCMTDCRAGYMLFPWFGGTQTAPHEMHIDIMR